MAMLSCAVFGWLIRFVPAPRLKAVGNWTELVVWLAFVWLPQAVRFLPHVHLSAWLPAPGVPRVALGVALAVLMAVSITFGLRSLSVDYMIRVSSIVHGGSGAKRQERRGHKSSTISGWFGGQRGRAGFEFVVQMLTRDWAFLRQTVPLAPLLILAGVMVAPGLRVAPFSGHFTRLHILPHVFGVMLFSICTFIAYGNDYKGAWVFLLAPTGALDEFARGVFGVLWVGFIAIPHLFILALLTWFWGIRPAAVFLAYSLAVASLHLGLELRLIESVPFSKQPGVSQGFMLMPMMVIGGLGAGAAVALQHFFIFHSVATALSTTAIIGAGAYFIIRSSLRSFASSMRYNLGLVSGESSFLYKEVNG
jgi:hypothetical protein